MFFWGEKTLFFYPKKKTIQKAPLAPSVPWTSTHWVLRWRLSRVYGEKVSGGGEFFGWVLTGHAAFPMDFLKMPWFLVQLPNDWILACHGNDLRFSTVGFIGKHICLKRCESHGWINGRETMLNQWEWVHFLDREVTLSIYADIYRCILYIYI